MKITVKNLGAVEQAEIDLKPLTVFVGHNGTGKTWTAYALASIFSSYGCNKYLESYLEGKTQQTYAILDRAVEQFLNEGSIEIDVVQFAKENMQTYINDVAFLAPTWMRSYLSTKRLNFEDLIVQIDLHNCEALLAEGISTSSAYRSLSVVSKKITGLKYEHSNQIIFFEESKRITNEKTPTRIIKEFICGGIFELLHRVFFLNSHLFPTERTTFITVPINIGKNIESEDSEQIRKTSDIFGFSYPISSFISMISEVSSISLDDRIGDMDSKNYINLASFLEEKILQGRGDFEESEIYRELLFSTDKNIKLEMSVTSSMIKELIPLVLYLRYLAEQNDLIVIDEPEMNLHPAAQIEIIEFLAMLVNAGLNVMITTHSPYIVDHISNLIEAKKHNNPEEIKDYFYLEDSRAFIEQDKVSVYLFENNTAKNILAEDGSIDWSTFWDESSHVSNIYAQLLKNKKV